MMQAAELRNRGYPDDLESLETGFCSPLFGRSLDSSKATLATGSRFFTLPEISKEELEQLTRREPVMSKAPKVLEELSQDE